MGRLYKSMIRKTLSGLYLILFLVLLVCPLNAFAADGSLRINLKNSKGEGVAGIEFQIFQVGTVSNEDGQPAFYAEYGISTYPQTAEEMEDITAKLQNKIDIIPLQTGTTNAEGILDFRNIEKGVYFVVANIEESKGEIMPLVIQLPYYEVVNGQMVGPSYYVEAEPKAEFYSASSEQPEDLPDDEIEECPTTRIKSSDPAKTGDESKIGFYLCVALSSVLLVIGVMMKYRVSVVKGLKESEEL